MQIVFTEDNLHEILKPVFWRKKNKKKISKYRLLKILPRVLNVNFQSYVIPDAPSWADITWAAPSENMLSGHARTPTAQTRLPAWMWSDQRLRCLLPESLYTIECTKCRQKPGWDLGHVQDDDLNPNILRMLEDTFSLAAAHLLGKMTTPNGCNCLKQICHNVKWMGSQLIFQTLILYLIRNICQTGKIMLAYVTSTRHKQ